MSDQPIANLYGLAPNQVEFIRQMLKVMPVSGPIDQVRPVVAMADSIEAALARPVAVENAPGEKT